jgi:hypothetical protein
MGENLVDRQRTFMIGRNGFVPLLGLLAVCGAATTVVAADAAGTIIPQVATLQPLTVILQYKQSF